MFALAALAATGASFAQVTITGTIASGFQQSISNSYSNAGNLITTGNAAPAFANTGTRTGVTQNMSSGFGVDTADIIFTAKEDIGGGQSVEAKLGLANVMRGSSTTVDSAYGTPSFGPGDVTLSYTNMSFGRIQLGTARDSALHSGMPSAGAPVIDMDGKLFQKRSSSDFINYAVPVGPVTLVYQYGEGSKSAQPESVADGLGAGTSGSPAATPQRSNTLLAIYKDGPLELLGAYKMYDNTDATSIGGVYGLTKDRQYAIQASYDLGMAKLGFGYAYTNATVGATVADMTVGANVPMGALEIGATWSQEVVGGLAGVPAATYGGATVKNILQQAEGTATGWSLGAKYNLSKRTSFKANFASWTRSGYEQFEAFSQVKASSTTLAAAAAAAAAVPANLGAAVAAGNGAAASVYAAGGTTQQAAQTVAGAKVVETAAPQLGYGPIETQFNLLLSYSF